MSDFLTRVLFEDLVLLLIAEAVVMAIVLAVHRRRYTARTRRSIGVALGVCIVLIGLQGLIKTDREQIKEQVTAMARAVDEGDIPALAEAVARDFTDGTRDRAAFLTDVSQLLQRAQADEVKVGGFKVEVAGDRATASFRAICDWRAGNQVQRSVLSFWALEFARRDDGWKLIRIVSAKIGPGGLLNYQDAWKY